MSLTPRNGRTLSPILRDHADLYKGLVCGSLLELHLVDSSWSLSSSRWMVEREQNTTCTFPGFDSRNCWYRHSGFPILNRASFGIFGAWWPTFNRAVMAIVWNGVNAVQGSPYSMPKLSLTNSHTDTLKQEHSVFMLCYTLWLRTLRIYRMLCKDTPLLVLLIHSRVLSAQLLWL